VIARGEYDILRGIILCSVVVQYLIVGAANGSDAAIAGHDHDGREIVLKCAVEIRKALNVEHVHLVDEQHAGDDLGLAFFAPLAHLGVDLLAHFALDLACISREESQKSLRATVDDIDLVQRDCVYDFLPFLEFTFGAIDKFKL
jgi:hypothetical protein